MSPNRPDVPQGRPDNFFNKHAKTGDTACCFLPNPLARPQTRTHNPNLSPPSHLQHIQEQL